MGDERLRSPLGVSNCVSAIFHSSLFTLHSSLKEEKVTPILHSSFFILHLSGIIPLPKQYEPYPSADGIVFTYAQYEIACYAAGMPTFTIPYSDVQPFLSEDFLKIIKADNR